MWRIGPTRSAGRAMSSLPNPESTSTSPLSVSMRRTWHTLFSERNGSIVPQFRWWTFIAGCLLGQI